MCTSWLTSRLHRRRRPPPSAPQLLQWARGGKRVLRRRTQLSAKRLLRTTAAAAARPSLHTLLPLKVRCEEDSQGRAEASLAGLVWQEVPKTVRNQQSGSPQVRISPIPRVPSTEHRVLLLYCSLHGIWDVSYVLWPMYLCASLSSLSASPGLLLLPVANSRLYLAVGG